jgi:hypothetical protein
MFLVAVPDAEIQRCSKYSTVERETGPSSQSTRLDGRHAIANKTQWSPTEGVTKYEKPQPLIGIALQLIPK